MVQVKTALLSTYYKDGLHILADALQASQVDLISTGGTHDWLLANGHQVQRVEDITHFPEMLGGRVKTLHPKVFGGILNRRSNAGDQAELVAYDIPSIDLVVVNLYPFSETLASGGSHAEMIEKIDIGGISLIRAAAKNYSDVVIVADPADYEWVAKELLSQNGFISNESCKWLAAKAFGISASYDAAIAQYLNGSKVDELPPRFSASFGPGQPLRYGENPHQKAAFYGNLQDAFDQLHGKALSYNNLVDTASAMQLVREWDSSQPVVAIVKHTNACGVAEAASLSDAYTMALACDPVSAFGGVIACNAPIDVDTAQLLHNLFFEVLLAPGFEPEALEVLQTKKNRILLKDNLKTYNSLQIKSLFNGVLVQELDGAMVRAEDCQLVTHQKPTESDWKNLLFANKIVKHTKSNTIVLAKNGRLLASGTGQTSRVDALRQAIEKANHFGFDLNGSAMASDAFFPFPDCIEIAARSGISAVIQPGGSIKDQDSIDACNRLHMSMVTTGVRHFKH